METKIVQFTAGITSPVECSWVVAKVVKAFLQEIKKQGYHSLVLHTEKGIVPTTIKNTLIRVQNPSENPLLEEFLKQWIGTIQWVGHSIFRENHPRKNWFIRCVEIPTTTLLAFSPTEFTYTTFRSSGAGGQHVNKVSTAVRATHLKTKMNVMVQESRSQYQNKKLAKTRLIQKLEEKRWEQLQQNPVYKNQTSNRGNPIRVFNGGDFKKKPRKTLYASKRQQLKQQLKNDLNRKLWD